MGTPCGENGIHALVAQRIRASDYGSEGREFESLQARFFIQLLLPFSLGRAPPSGGFFCVLTKACRLGVLSYDQGNLNGDQCLNLVAQP